MASEPIFTLSSKGYFTFDAFNQSTLFYFDASNYRTNEEALSSFRDAPDLVIGSFRYESDMKKYAERQILNHLTASMGADVNALAGWSANDPSILFDKRYVTIWHLVSDIIEERQELYSLPYTRERLSRESAWKKFKSKVEYRERFAANAFDYYFTFSEKQLIEF